MHAGSAKILPRAREAVRSWYEDSLSYEFGIAHKVKAARVDLQKVDLEVPAKTLFKLANFKHCHWNDAKVKERKACSLCSAAQSRNTGMTPRLKKEKLVLFANNLNLLFRLCAAEPCHNDG